MTTDNLEQTVSDGTMVNSFIYKKKNSLTNNLCENIITFFEAEGDNRHEGLISSGLSKNIKDSLDFNIPIVETSNWYEIYNILIDELNNALEEYINLLYDKTNNKFFKTDFIKNTTFLIQRYEKGIGKYKYHNDSVLDLDNKKNREITFIWYLNDITEGGETEFFGGELTIKPETGKLIIFPANWTFPHCGKTPISDNKYIITGWIYRSIDII